MPYFYAAFLEKILDENNGLFARGADRDDAERDARDLGHALQIFPRAGGERVVGADTGGKVS